MTNSPMKALNKQTLRQLATDAHELGIIKRYTKGIEANKRFVAIATPLTVLALLDELEAAEHQNGYLREQRDEWERKAISNFEECTEMSARIEELESQRKLAFTASNRWADKFREAEKRIAELSASHSKLRDTMATIHNTIRMDGGYTPLAAILNAAKRAHEESAIAAGIGVKGE
ncbi:ead/Ea22-like family protein [Citrobacter freundii]|uniref:ead/Ea22-like family protein n=1 Tax=Citrobacter freundii TaxID=546 RepID=UPI00300D8ABD